MKEFLQKRIDSLIGIKYGKYTVIGYGGHKHNGAMHLKCKCECGNENIVNKQALVNGRITQCLQCGVTASNKRRTRHGKCNTTTYNIWRTMTKRCRDPKHKCYHRYGGRGIQVCERWQTFENFLKDMGERPSGLQLDRIDNDGNYEPQNCRWCTPKENVNNRKDKRRARRCCFLDILPTLTD